MGCGNQRWWNPPGTDERVSLEADLLRERKAFENVRDRLMHRAELVLDLTRRFLGIVGTPSTPVGVLEMVGYTLAIVEAINRRDGYVHTTWPDLVESVRQINPAAYKNVDLVNLPSFVK